MVTTSEFPYDFRAGPLAELLAVEESRMLKAITEEEILNYLTKKETQTIRSITRWSQLLSHWVASEVCKPEDIKSRVEVIKFFLVTARQCRLVQNFNGMYEIMRGLSLSPCQRLLKTWKALPASFKEMYQDMSNLLSPKDNYAAYRDDLRQSIGNVLPIFKVYLTDLHVVCDKMETEFSGNRVNFYKFHVLGNILNSVYFCQKNTEYKYAEDQALKDYLSDMISLHAYSDADSLVKLSRAREPPLPSAELLIFGVDLSIAVDRTGVFTSTEGTVPSCVRDIVEVLRLDKNKKTLGLFRKSGNQTNIKKMKSQIDRVGGLVFDLENANCHDVAGLLKLYFSELPDPLFTGQLFQKFIAVSDLKDRQRRLEIIQGLFIMLPKAHLDVVIYLLQFLSEISQTEENQMDAKNLAVCFAPTLFGKKKHVRKISRLQGRMSQALDIKKESLENDIKRQEGCAQVLQIMIENFSDLIQSVMFGKDRIDYTRRDSVVQF